MKKRIIKMIFLLVVLIILLPYICFLYQRYNYPVEMYQQPLEIEYDFTKPGITLEEVQALNGNQAVIEYQEKYRIVYSIEGVISSQKICSLEEALAVLYDYRDIFELGGFEYAGIMEEEDDLIYYKLRQLKNGVYVRGYGFTIVTTKEGDAIRIIGDYLGVFEFDPDSILSHRECVRMNKQYFKGSEIAKAQLLICKFPNRTELCWRYEVFSRGPSPHVSVSISAITGEIVWISGEAIS